MITIAHPANYICQLEAKGYAKCLMAYSEHSGEDIECIGFNPNSGYTYIALENTISICSCMGGDVEYLVTDFDSGEEEFFQSYDDAMRKLDEICEKQNKKD